MSSVKSATYKSLLTPFYEAIDLYNNQYCVIRRLASGNYEAILGSEEMTRVENFSEDAAKERFKTCRLYGGKKIIACDQDDLNKTVDLYYRDPEYFD